MLPGICLLLLTGICWVGIALVVNRAASRALDIDVIQTGAAGLILLAALGILLLRPAVLATAAPQGWMIACVSLAGVGNYIMLKLMRRAMVLGSSGAVWAIAQSALILPFLMGMVFFHVMPSICRITGILLILLGIVLFAKTKPRREKLSSKGWLFPALGAFLASGMAQCLANLPSYWQENPMPSEMRAGLVQFGTILAFCGNIPLPHRRFRIQGTLKPLLLLSAVQILSLFFLFYRGLNLVAEAGGGSIGYPVAQGGSIAFFLLYSQLVLKECRTWCAGMALLAICGGIAFFAF